MRGLLIAFIATISVSACESHETIDSTRIRTVHGAFLPNVGKDCTLVCTHLYVLSLDCKTKFAEWCTYRITPDMFATRNVLTRNWINVAPLDSCSLEFSDFLGNEYDTGHLVPLASVKASPYAFEANAMIAVAPQTPELNRGPWLELEIISREMSQEHGYVDVIVGPLFTSSMPKLPNADEPHRVPSHYWMYLVSNNVEKAFIVPQKCERQDNASKFAVSKSVLFGKVPALNGQ